MTAPERWVSVVGYEGLYEVSDAGRVRSVDRTVVDVNGMARRYRGRPVPIRPAKGWAKYPNVVLRRDGRPHYRQLAHVVAEAHVGPRPPGQVLRHWDDVRDHCAATNLLYGTESDNAYDRVRNGREPKTKRERCPQKHRLVPPNIVGREARAGRRACLACSRAKSLINQSIRHGRPPADLQELSDEKYAVIMMEVAA